MSKIVCVRCAKDGEMEDMVVVDYPKGNKLIWFHVECMDMVVQYCLDALQGKRVRGW